MSLFPFHLFHAKHFTPSSKAKGKLDESYGENDNDFESGDDEQEQEQVAGVDEEDRGGSQRRRRRRRGGYDDDEDDRDTEGGDYGGNDADDDAADDAEEEKEVGGFVDRLEENRRQCEEIQVILLYVCTSHHIQQISTQCNHLKNTPTINHSTL